MLMGQVLLTQLPLVGMGTLEHQGMFTRTREAPAHLSYASYVNERGKGKPIMLRSWFNKLLQRLDIEVVTIPVPLTVVQVLLNEEEKLTLKLEAIRDHIEDQLVNWVVNDERRALGGQDCFGGSIDGSSELAAHNVVSINEGRVGFSNTSIGRSTVRKQRGQR